MLQPSYQAARTCRHGNLNKSSRNAARKSCVARKTRGRSKAQRRGTVCRPWARDDIMPILEENDSPRPNALDRATGSIDKSADETKQMPPTRTPLLLSGCRAQRLGQWASSPRAPPMTEPQGNGEPGRPYASTGAFCRWHGLMRCTPLAAAARAPVSRRTTR